ncbi:MAG: hypothetical protein RL748_4296, partial [Pseudomonadota bacterium]
MKPVSSDPGQNGQSGQSGQNAETSTRTGMAATRPLPALLPLLLLLAMAMPMLVLYAMGALGPMLLPAWQIQAGQLGWISSTSFALAAVLSLWAGRVVAQLGARRSLIALFLALALAYALMISLHGFAGVVLALAVGSLAQALCNPATNLLIAQQVPAAHKARVVGLKQAGVQLAALFAGLVLPAMAQQWG